MKNLYALFWVLFILARICGFHSYSYWWVFGAIIAYVIFAVVRIILILAADQVEEEQERARRKKKTGFSTRLEEALHQQKKAHDSRSNL